MRWLIFLLVFISANVSFSQTDSVNATPTPKAEIIEKEASDTLARPTQRNPKRAALMSAVAPGLGQIYNKSYWKLPIVYGALGTTGFFVVSNRVLFNQFIDAYVEHEAAIEASGNDGLLYDNRYSLNDLQNQALAYQTQMEYAGIIFLAFYLMQVVDAAVDAHLYYFDVSEDLSLNWQPSFQTTAMAPQTAGLSLTLTF